MVSSVDQICGFHRVNTVGSTPALKVRVDRPHKFLMFATNFGCRNRDTCFFPEKEGFFGGIFLLQM